MSTDDSRLIVDSPFTVKSIISYGLIVYCPSTDRWIIVQRKHSAESLLLFRGLYRQSYLPLLLHRITEEEAEIITRSLDDETYYRYVYSTVLQLDRQELEYSLIRLRETKTLIREILRGADLSQNTLLWGWPKGRLQNSNGLLEKESPLQCAQREFREEIEITLPPPLYLSDNYVTEYVKTISGRVIESRYWIYLVDKEIPISAPQNHPEVSNRAWVNSETCRRLIAHDSLFEEVVDIIHRAL